MTPQQRTDCVGLFAGCTLAQLTRLAFVLHDRLSDANLPSPERTTAWLQLDMIQTELQARARVRQRACRLLRSAVPVFSV